MMTPIQAENTDHLKQLIESHMRSYGVRVNLNHIDVSKITDMESLFEQSKFKGDISQWNVSNVENMMLMFADSRFNGDISKWNTANVQDMTMMFSHCPFQGDLSQWDVSKVRSMRGMFQHHHGPKYLDGWNVSNVESMRGMFLQSEGVLEVSKWNTSNVKDMEFIFMRSLSQGDVSQWDLSSLMKCGHAYSTFADNILGYAGVLQQEYEFPKNHPQAELFRELTMVCQAMNLDTLSTAKYIHLNLSGREVSKILMPLNGFNVFDF